MSKLKLNNLILGHILGGNLGAINFIEPVDFHVFQIPHVQSIATLLKQLPIHLGVLNS